MAPIDPSRRRVTPTTMFADVIIMAGLILAIWASAFIISSIVAISMAIYKYFKHRPAREDFSHLPLRERYYRSTGREVPEEDLIKHSFGTSFQVIMNNEEEFKEDMDELRDMMDNFSKDITKK